MSWDLNHVSLIGRLTRDPEIRYSQQGNAYAILGIAVNRRSGTKDKVNNEVYYFNIVVFGKLAEICNDYLAKGKQAAVSGYLRQKRWEKNGEKFSAVEILAEQVQFLSPNVNAEGNYVKRSSNNFNKEQNKENDEIVDVKSLPKNNKNDISDNETNVIDEEIPF